MNMSQYGRTWPRITMTYTGTLRNDTFGPRKKFVLDKLCSEYLAYADSFSSTAPYCLENLVLRGIL